MGLLRKAVIVPGNLLPQPQPGKFHVVLVSAQRVLQLWFESRDSELPGETIESSAGGDHEACRRGEQDCRSEAN